MVRPDRNDIARYGLTKTITAAIFRRVERHLGLHIWAIQTRPLYADFKLPADHEARFRFKRLTLPEALEAANDPNLHISAAFVQDAFARADICEATFDGPDVVAYCWRSTSRAYVTADLWIRLHGRGIRYGYKTFVRPEYRGMRLSNSNARIHDNKFISDGIDTDIGYVALHNLESMKNAYRDPNRKFIGCAGYLEVGGRFLTFRTRKVRRFLSFERHHPGALTAPLSGGTN